MRVTCGMGRPGYGRVTVTSPLLEFLGTFGGSLALAALTVALPTWLVVASRPERRSAVLPWATAPAVLTLLAFASLAVHLWRTAGGWPEQLGTDGLGASVALHTELSWVLVGALLLGLGLVVPVGLIACASVPRLRAGLRPLSVYASAGLCVLAVMSLAPAPFLDWWWD